MSTSSKSIKELVILSGKGGTGKTTLTAAIAQLAGNLVLADCDVDAADLHLITNPKRVATHPFISGKEATVISEKCTGCAAECRFDAFETLENGKLRINPIRCEGCGLCVHLCPEGAIAFEPRTCGQWMLSDTRFGPMVHARLLPAEENSGRLVTVVRKEARQIAQQQNKNFILCDGPPGIGCPVISSVTGADAILLVTEPSLSSMHDFTRVGKLARQFQIPAYVCINRADMHPELALQMQKLITQEGHTWVGNIDYDQAVVSSQLEGKTIIEYGESKIITQIQKVWENIWQLMNNQS